MYTRSLRSSIMYFWRWIWTSLAHLASENYFSNNSNTVLIFFRICFNKFRVTHFYVEFLHIYREKCRTTVYIVAKMLKAVSFHRKPPLKFSFQPFADILTCEKSLKKIYSNVLRMTSKQNQLRHGFRVYSQKEIEGCNAKSLGVCVHVPHLKFLGKNCKN